MMELMKRSDWKWLGVGAVILVGLVSLALYRGLFRYVLFDPAWNYKGMAVQPGDCSAGNPEIVELTNNCLMMYTHGQTKESHPSENNAYARSSCDGKAWKWEGLVLKNAGMPTAVRLPDGRIRLYFIRAEERDGKAVKGMMSAISDDGLKFTEEPGYLFEMAAAAPRPDEMSKFRQYYPVPGEGKVEDIKDFAHLNVAKMDNGYRIYFDEGAMRADTGKYGEDKAWPLWRERSIFSEDGLISWRLDPGVRIDVGQAPLTQMQRSSNPSVVKLKDGYHLFFFAGFSPWEDLTPWKRLAWSGTYEAVSGDGLNFEIINWPKFPGNDAAVIRRGDKLLAYPGRAQAARPGCSDVVMFERKLTAKEK